MKIYLETNKKNIIRFFECFLCTWALTVSFHIATFHIGGVLVFIGVYLLSGYSVINDDNRAIETASAAGGFLFSLFTLMGDYKGITGDLTGGLFIVLIFVITGFGLFLFYRRCLLILYKGIAGGYKNNRTDNNNRTDDNNRTNNNDRTDKDDRIENNNRTDDNNRIEKKSSQTGKKELLTFFFLLLVVWMPHFLANFPGIMTVDSLNQYGQLIGELPLSDHHPFVHTAFIGLCLNVGRVLFGSETGAIALYSVIQMVLMAAVYTYTLATMKKADAPPAVITGAFVFFGLIPYNALYSMTMWKDILFSAVVLLFTNVLIRILLLRQKNIKLCYALFIISGLLMCLLRSNGLPAFFLTALVIPIAVSEKKEKIRMVAASIVILIVAVGIKGPLFNSLSLQKGDAVEALSIPIQMMARVYADGESVREEDDNKWKLIMDTSKIPEVYEDFCSDHMKNLIREGDQEYLSANMMEYGKLWAGFGVSHPLAYIRGFIDATKGYYYPDVPGIIGADYSIAPNEYGLSPSPILKGSVIIKAGEILIKLPKMVPLYGLIYSPGALFWLMIILLSGCMIKGGMKSAVVFIPNLAVFATLMAATPVNNEFRYIYSMVICLPLYMACTLINSCSRRLEQIM